MEEIKEKEKLIEENESADSADTQPATTPESPKEEDTQLAAEGDETTGDKVETEEETNTDEIEEKPEIESEPEEISETETAEVETNEPELPISDKIFSQEEANALIGKARAEGRQSATNEILERFGVNSIEEIGDIIGKAQQFDYISEEYSKANQELGEYRVKDTLTNANVLPEMFDDIKYYMKGKGVDITPESLGLELETHPNWLKPEQPIVGGEVKDIVKQVRDDFKKGPQKSIITASANESTNNSNLMSDDESELDEVRSMYNIR